MTDSTVPKPSKKDKPWQFKAGQPSANPAGRPKGSKDKLSGEYIGDLYQIWLQRGAQAIHDMIDDDPGAFVRVIASILPKDVNLTDERLVIRAPVVSTDAEQWAMTYAPKPKMITLPTAPIKPTNGNGNGDNGGGTSH
jgi:hypothetical protein